MLAFPFPLWFYGIRTILIVTWLSFSGFCVLFLLWFTKRCVFGRAFWFTMRNPLKPWPSDQCICQCTSDTVSRWLLRITLIDQSTPWLVVPRSTCRIHLPNKRAQWYNPLSTYGPSTYSSIRTMESDIGSNHAHANIAPFENKLHTLHYTLLVLCITSHVALFTYPDPHQLQHIPPFIASYHPGPASRSAPSGPFSAAHEFWEIKHFESTLLCLQTYTPLKDRGQHQLPFGNSYLY